MLAQYFLSLRLSVRLSVCLSQAGIVSKRLNLWSQKQRSPGSLVLWCERSVRNSDGITPNGGAKCSAEAKIAFFDRLRSLRLRRLTAENLSIRHGGPLPRRFAGGGIGGVINNFGGSLRLLVTVTVQLTSTRLAVRKSVDDTHDSL